jgi:hypothetical protein
MSRRLLTLVALVATFLFASATVASANDGNGGYGTTKTAGASTGQGTVKVGVGIDRRHKPSAADPTTTAPASGSGSGTSTTDPPQTAAAPTYTCTTGPIELLAFQELMGVGGPEPGYWAITECTGPGAPAPSRPFWVVDTHPGAPAAAGAPAPPPNPVAVALQAEKQLTLPATTIEMAPPAATAQLVNVSSWLWLNPATWKPYTATASIGGVSATATATPEQVVWNMGDGNSVTCDGPGTPYDPSQPNATTNCSYTWTTPSVGEPGGDYAVSATTKWQVTWTAIGAPGGGNLGLVAGAAANAEVVVTESQAINTPSAPVNHGSP